MGGRLNESHVTAFYAEPLRSASIGRGRWLFSFCAVFDDPARPWTAALWAHPDEAGKLLVTKVEVTARDGGRLSSTNTRPPITEIARLGADLLVTFGPDLPPGSPPPLHVLFEPSDRFRRDQASDRSARKLDSLFLAQAAQVYVNAPEGETAEAVQQFAGYANTMVARNLIRKLRPDRYGMLTETQPRVAGGRLTPKARRILKKAGLLEEKKR